MSGSSPSRAAVFSSSPQSVEIYERGAWWPGSMLGWRHDSGGRCQAWVRVEFAGVVEDAWVDLALLRLPELRDRQPARAGEPQGAATARPGEAQDEGAREHPEVTETQSLELVRDEVARDGGRGSGGAGRRRAPETSGEPAVNRPVADATAGSSSLGRHRAPAAAAAGRHRATDAGASDVPPSGAGSHPPAGRPADRWLPPPPRAELPPAGPVVRPTSPHPQAGADLLTRPMRLDEAVGSARRLRRDSLSRV